MPDIHEWKVVLAQPVSSVTPRINIFRKAVMDAIDAAVKRQVWPNLENTRALGFIGTIEEPAQDQYVIKGNRGFGEEIFRAHKACARDLQSEVIETRNWLESSVSPEDFLSWHNGLEEQENEVPSITSDQLTSQLLELDQDRDKARLRELIMIAEDTAFTPEQSDILAPRLIALALAYRDSAQVEDEPIVWSAIRTGASMLSPHAANKLLPLAEPGHPIETSLVAVKMLGRIFEAYPPSDIDQFSDLATQVMPIVRSLLNRYAVALNQSAAMAQCAIYALVGMASSSSVDVMRAVRELNLAWFTRRTSRKLRQLMMYWQKPHAISIEAPLDLLNKCLRHLDS